MAYLGRGLDKISNIEVLDNITFDGSSSYSITKNSVAFTPNSAQSLLISIDGVVQATNFSVNSSTIDFGVAIPSTSVCNFFLHYGTGVITVPSDGSVTEAKIGTGAVTSAKLASGAVPNQSAFKNIIINGDMSIAQRGTSASGLTTTTTYNTADRWRLATSSAGTWTQSQSTDVPTGQGFAKSLKMDCTTADASLASGDYVIIQQLIEGQNLQYLKKGTANAESLTLSFWVKSNKIGTYITELLDTDNSRQISKSYTINSANTWEKKTITYVGDTTGAFNNDNALSLEVNFWLGAGSTYTSGTLATSWESQTSANRAVGQVNLADNTANEWLITGVMLESGTVASSFETLPVDIQLMRCQRYYQTTQSFVGNGSSNTSQCVGETAIGIPMRATPSLSLSGNFVITDGYTSDYTQSSASIGVYSNSAETRSFMVIIQNLPTLVTAKPYHARHSNSSVIQFSSEL